MTMSVHMIYYKDGVKMMRPVHTREEYLALRNGGEQQAVVQAVRQGDESRKSRLVQVNYSCLPNDDGTLKGSKRMSSTVGMDIDHLKAEDMPTVKERILQKKDELGLLMLEESVRGAGYHLVFKRRPDLDQVGNLKWASDLLEVAYDAQAKDITRVFFTTTEEELIYLDDAIFETTEAVLTNTNCTNHTNREVITTTDLTDKTDNNSTTNCTNYTNRAAAFSPPLLPLFKTPMGFCKNPYLFSPKPIGVFLFHSILYLSQKLLLTLQPQGYNKTFKHYGKN